MDVVATVANGLDLLGYSSSIKYMVTGAILLGAVTLDTVSRRTVSARLLHAGVPVELHVYPGAFHAFDLMAVAGVRVGWQHMNNKASDSSPSAAGSWSGWWPQSPSWCAPR